MVNRGRYLGAKTIRESKVARVLLSPRNVFKSVSLHLAKQFVVKVAFRISIYEQAQLTREQVFDI